MSCETLATWVEAIGTVAVAIVAIWGDWFRAQIAGPKLKLALHDPNGDLTVRTNGTRTRYYHIKVTNEREWSPAKRVRLLVKKLEKRRPDGTYSALPLAVPVQLIWVYGFSKTRERFPTVATEDFCDLGCIDEGSQQFAVTCYEAPNNWRGYVSAGDTLRVHIVVAAENFESKSPLVVDISWDGKWSTDAEEMQRHLVIKEIEVVEGK